MNNPVEKQDRIRMEVPYFQTPNTIFDILPDIQSKIIGCYLARCANQGATAWPSYQTIADKCSMDRSTAIRTIKKMVEKGFLVKEHRKPEGDEYWTNTYILDLGGSGTQPLGSGRETLGSGTQPPNKEPVKEEPVIKNQFNKDKAFTSESRDLTEQIETKYFRTYKEATGEDHPALKADQHTRIKNVFLKFAQDYASDIHQFNVMITAHFERTDGLKTDFNINHFASPGILENLYHKHYFQSAQRGY